MKDFMEKLKELKKTRYGKAILFFGFYFVFFLVIVVGIRFGSKAPLSRYDEYENGNSKYNFKVDKLLEDNFNFNYVVSLDENSFEYIGERNKERELFKFNDRNYYRDESFYYLLETSWIRSDNPYLFSEFLDVNKIIELLALATYKAKTSYDSGAESYIFMISSNTINQHLYGINSDYFEVPNEIVVDTDSSNVINTIEFNLDSYCKVNKKCQNSLRIKLNYSKYGEVSEIVSPVK